jgi:hypothetical protein
MRSTCPVHLVLLYLLIIVIILVTWPAHITLLYLIILMVMVSKCPAQVILLELIIIVIIRSTWLSHPTLIYLLIIVIIRSKCLVHRMLIYFIIMAIMRSTCPAHLILLDFITLIIILLLCPATRRVQHELLGHPSERSRLQRRSCLPKEARENDFMWLNSVISVHFTYQVAAIIAPQDSTPCRAARYGSAWVAYRGLVTRGVWRVPAARQPETREFGQDVAC